MAESTLLQKIQDDMKVAMRAKDSARLSAIRMLLAAIKQREIDEQITLDENQLLAVVEKQVKQRRESATQYEQAGREDLATKENFEITVLQTYLPQQLSAEEVTAIIERALAEAGTTSIRDMGKIMALIKPQVQGRADMGQISAQVKAKLS